MKDIINIILAGIIGTAAMTFCMYLASFLFKKVMKVVKILGTMLTFNTTEKGELSDKPIAIFVGIIAHYLIGILFALIFLFLWNKGIGKPDLFYGAIFGLASGILGIIVWKLFFLIHPNPPKTINLNDYFFYLVLSHIILGIVISLAFSILSGKPYVITMFN